MNNEQLLFFAWGVTSVILLAAISKINELNRKLGGLKKMMESHMENHK
jgi:hypothetical protein